VNGLTFDGQGLPDVGADAGRILLQQLRHNRFPRRRVREPNMPALFRHGYLQLKTNSIENDTVITCVNHAESFFLAG
jgi:hypothetical protein